MKKLWEPLFKKFSVGDISFFILRLGTILGGIVWLSLAPLAPDEATKLIKALVAFSAYSILLYLFMQRIFINRTPEQELLAETYHVSKEVIIT